METTLSLRQRFLFIRRWLVLAKLCISLLVAYTTGPTRADDAYKTTKEIVAETEGFKILGKETILYLRRGIGGWHLQVAILVSHDDPAITYAEVTMHAYDDRGNELPLRVMTPIAKIYMVSGTNTYWGGSAFGDYLFNMGKKRRLVSVQFIRGGEKHTFVFPR